MYVTVEDWAAVMEDEYLRSFIPSGGATVKFVVLAEPAQATRVREMLEGMALRNGMYGAFVDSAATRIHMIEALFHQIARQVDWQALAADYMRRLLQADGFVLPDDPLDFTFAGIAHLNTDDEPELRRRVRSLLHDRVATDYAMAQEFRTAMLLLCQALLDTGPSERAQAEALILWLRGELRLISSLKFARIFQKIGRNNARDMLFSLAHWLRLIGKQGLLLVLDISRYLGDRRSLQPDGGLFYSIAATVDAYEVLRQFIDGTDELESCFIAVLAPMAFLQDDHRGLARYDALRLRVWDEVRDRQRANPVSGLIRLRESPAPMQG